MILEIGLSNLFARKYFLSNTVLFIFDPDAIVGVELNPGGIQYD
jgi:hypothetical protein